MANEIENHVLRGGEFRTELRASIKTFGSDKAKSDWRTCNASVKAIAERNPVWSAERIANHVLERQRSTTERADELARPFGTAKDIVLEQAEFWVGRRRAPEDAWLHFAFLYLERDYGLIDAAELAGLEIAAARIVGFRIVCAKSFQWLANRAGVGKTTAHRRWLRCAVFVEHAARARRDCRATEKNWDQGLRSGVPPALSKRC